MNTKGKIMIGALAGAITAVGVWLLKEFTSVVMPAEVAAAAQVIITALVQFVTPDEMEG